MPKSVKQDTGKDPAKSKLQPPRDADDRRNVRLTADERTALLEYREREAAAYVNPDPQSGFDLTIRVFSATIEGDQIRMMVKIEGAVLRPGMEAHAKGGTQEIAVPAIIVTEGIG